MKWHRFGTVRCCERSHYRGLSIALHGRSQTVLESAGRRQGLFALCGVQNSKSPWPPLQTSPGIADHQTSLEDGSQRRALPAHAMGRLPFSNGRIGLALPPLARKSGRGSSLRDGPTSAKATTQAEAQADRDEADRPSPYDSSLKREHHCLNAITQLQLAQHC